MVDRIDSPFSTNTQNFDIEPDRVGDITGSYKGQEVSVKSDASSMIADSAEEVTFAASEKVETKLAKRKIKGNKELSSGATEQAENFIKKLPDIGNVEKLKDFLVNLKSKDIKDSGQAREAAKEFFKDFSHQYAALEFVKEAIKDDDDAKELLEIVDKATGELLEEHGPEIRSALNISEDVINATKDGLGDTQEVRDFYRDTVLDYDGISQTFKDIQTKYKDEGMFKAIDFLMSSIGSDLSSGNPSISSTELKKINDDVFQLRLICNLHSDCQALINKINKEF